MNIFEWSVARTDWAKLRAAGDPRQLPTALYALASASSAEQAAEAYWHIDNVAVVQASVFEAAEHVVLPVVLMLQGERSPWTIRCALDLLVQLTGGWINAGEQGHNDQLLERIKATARLGLATVYHLLGSTDAVARDRAIEVLEAIETDDARLAGVLRELASVETDPNVRQLALRVASQRSSGKPGFKPEVRVERRG